MFLKILLWLRSIEKLYYYVLFYNFNFSEPAIFNDLR